MSDEMKKQHERMVEFIAQRAAKTHRRVKEAQAMGIPPQMFARVPQLADVIDSIFWVGLVQHKGLVVREDLVEHATAQVKAAAIQHPERKISEATIISMAANMRDFLAFCQEFTERDLRDEPVEEANDEGSKLVVPGNPH